MFFINPRIEGLYDLEAMIRRLVPDARTVVAHGQMPPEKLEKSIADFVAHDYDILLATTIVESGIDIPNVNTIIINNAHNFGLSELHQLRGRVGRSARKAFCYLTIPPGYPLTPDARRRLQAIESFSDLGSGIHIAMQDLDIRGAGNLLGAEQSGFIADLGYETYQKILKEAVTELRTEEFPELAAADAAQSGAEEGDPGEFVAIVGQSGSGKSTAMNIIGCLDVPTGGKYFLGGVDVSTMDDDQQAEIRNKMLGFIFQQYNLIPKLNVQENVELPLLYAGLSAEARRAKAVHALERVGLADKRKNLPSQLSGGQQQRVSIARALAGDPSVILADEPTGALDSRTGREVLSFLQQLNREGNTVVLITHDNAIAVKAQRIVRLQDGKVIYDGDAHDPAAVVQPHDEDEEVAPE